MFNEGEEFSVEEIRTATGIGHLKKKKNNNKYSKCIIVVVVVVV